jgi:predicted metalloprotease with PDZ domain
MKAGDKRAAGNRRGGREPLITCRPTPGEVMSRALLGVAVAVQLAAVPVTLRAEASPAPPATEITLHVDLREAPRRLFHAHERLDAKPGPWTLVYPRWIPGEHGPTGPATDLSGLVIRVDGKPVAWRRDPIELDRFHFEVPPASVELSADFDFLSPAPETRGFSAGASASARLVLLSWNQVVLYPEGIAGGAVRVSAEVVLPEDWTSASALDVTATEGTTLRFAPVSLDTLVDSPLLAGRFLRTFELAAGAPGPRHWLVAAADSEAALAMPSEVQADLDHLVREAGRLFGAHPYRTYRFLLSLSDHVARFGLEHHESSDDRVKERALVDPDLRVISLPGLLPHEFVHAWNGKYRRPADMIAADFQSPIRTQLLWVYEGLTQYLGWVLATRSGLWTESEAHEELAKVAAWAQERGGRRWRPLEDTATAASQLYAARDDWENRRRGVDFYDEGLLVWLEADVTLRRLTGGRRSLDDFCRSFLGGQEGAPALRPYTFDDVVAELGRLAPYDWKGFFERRVAAIAPEAPLGGVEGAGWRLAWSVERGALEEKAEAEGGDLDFAASAGLTIDHGGDVVDVVEDGPADRAGIGPAMRVVAVDGRRFAEQVLRDALRASATRGDRKVDLLIENDDYFSTVSLDVPGGERHPKLERVAGAPDLLAKILAPRGR